MGIHDYKYPKYLNPTSPKYFNMFKVAQFVYKNPLFIKNPYL